MKTSFAIVDCNSFYSSCERVFDPKLRDKPVIVLSNNDGVVIARNAEAKNAGIKMGAPYYLTKERILKNKVYVYSSNFALYGDMSDRVMAILQEISSEIEIYSIDEAFLNFSLVPEQERVNFSKEIKLKILKETGIPVSIGIAPTKVLSKVANEIAKKSADGICDLTSIDMQERHLSTFPVEDIWGIGRHSTRKLRALGICTAADLKKINLADVEKLLTITGRRIVEELCGKSCLPLELVTERKKQIISSRSFGKPVFSVNELIEASSYYLSKACEKLRAQGSLCHEIRVFAHTNRFKNVKQYYNTGSLILSEPTASTALLNQAASQIIRAIFKPGIEYKKVGVILNDLISTQDFRPTLFTNKDSNLSQQKLMTTLDDINKRFGQGTIEFAACGIKKPWQMNSKLCSPRYTTCWDDIPTVLAK